MSADVNNANTAVNNANTTGFIGRCTQRVQEGYSSGKKWVVEHKKTVAAVLVLTTLAVLVGTVALTRPEYLATASGHAQVAAKATSSWTVGNPIKALVAVIGAFAVIGGILYFRKKESSSEKNASTSETPTQPTDVASGTTNTDESDTSKSDTSKTVTVNVPGNSADGQVKDGQEAGVTPQTQPTAASGATNTGESDISVEDDGSDHVDGQVDASGSDTTAQPQSTAASSATSTDESEGQVGASTNSTTAQTQSTPGAVVQEEHQPAAVSQKQEAASSSSTGKVSDQEKNKIETDDLPPFDQRVATHEKLIEKNTPHKTGKSPAPTSGATTHHTTASTTVVEGQDTHPSEAAAPVADAAASHAPVEEDSDIQFFVVPPSEVPTQENASSTTEPEEAKLPPPLADSTVSADAVNGSTDETKSS